MAWPPDPDEVARHDEEAYRSRGGASVQHAAAEYARPVGLPVRDVAGGGAGVVGGASGLRPAGGVCAEGGVAGVGAGGAGPGGVEVGAAVMAGALPHRHARSALGELVDDVRHWLLTVLPEQPDPTADVTLVVPKVLRRREWHAVACAFGDLVEDIAALFAIAVVFVLLVGAAAVVGFWAPWWVSAGLLLSVVAVFVVWRLRRAGRVLVEVVGELDAELDGDQ